jgi:hypothetical protein
MMKINVFGAEYGVELVENLLDFDLETPIRYGSIDYLNNTIKINSNFTERDQQKTLLHEILHACERELEPEDSLSDLQVSRVSRCLWGVLRENPGLVDFIFGDVKRKVKHGK